VKSFNGQGIYTRCPVMCKGFRGGPFRLV